MKASKQSHRGAKPRSPRGMDNFILTEKFEKPLVLSTYAGFEIVQHIHRCTKYTIDTVVVDGEGQQTRRVFPKDTCMFAVPAEKWDNIMPHLTKRASIVALSLGPEKFLADRAIVKKLSNSDACQVTLRNGFVLGGQIVASDRYNVLMRVGGKIVLIFKHAVHTLTEEHYGVSDR